MSNSKTASLKFYAISACLPTCNALTMHADIRQKLMPLHGLPFDVHLDQADLETTHRIFHIYTQALIPFQAGFFAGL